jgi:putative FmdB family regulatory protein
MPLYEWECLACDVRFEDLASVSEGRQGRACPKCGRMSPRVVSAFAIASGASPDPQPAAQSAKGARAAEAPICLRYPHIPLLCHMDKPTAERAVAYAQGRGAEHDDRKGQAEETRKKRGLPPPPPPAPPPHAHFHNPRRHQGSGAEQHAHSPAAHEHGHDHSTKGSKSKMPKAGSASAAPAHND